MLCIPWALWGCRRVTPSLRSRNVKIRSVRLLSSKSGDVDVESYDVICGSSGSITVDLYNSHHLATPTNPLIIHLPPTGVHLRSAQSVIPSFLFPRYPTTVANINYRWNIPRPLGSASPSKTPLSTHPSYAHHAFPTPLHDTLYAYNYLINTLLPSIKPQSSNRLRIQRPILIYGSHLGATLATSLALTEAISSKNYPVRIAGLVSLNGIYDWTWVASSKSPILEGNGGQELASIEQGQDWGMDRWDVRELHDLREKLFSDPAAALDSFVSPVLFFRTAEVSVPSRWPGSSSSPSPSALESYQELLIDSADIPPLPPDFDFEVSAESSVTSDMGCSSSNTPLSKKMHDDEELELTRISHLKFPPRGSGLKIPRSLFLTTASSTTPASSPDTKSSPSSRPTSRSSSKFTDITPREQAQEMARLMQRSVLLHEFKERALWDEDLDPQDAADDRVQLLSLSGKLEDKKAQTKMIEEWIEDTLS